MDIEKKGNELIIKVQLSNPKPSKTGKSEVYDSTHGFVMVNGGYKVNCNVIKPK